MKCIQSIILFLFLFTSCRDYSSSRSFGAQANYYTQGENNRMAAEWEPATGVMITWPLCIPYKLAIELSKDTRLYTLVDNAQSKQDALKWFQRWKIDTSHVTFITATQGIDAWWVRDWGPPAVFTSNKKMQLADGKYIYSTPVSGFASNGSLNFIYKTPENKIIRTDTDDKATIEVGRALNMEVLPLPYISTGGNVMTDGVGTAFSTSILTNENRFDGVNDKNFFTLNRELLGIDQYNILPNFESNGIQHIDCFMKLLDEETILVARPPRNHDLYEVYEDIINNKLSKLKTIYNRPYRIRRINTYVYTNQKGLGSLAAYTNSLILNKTVYVPLFGIPGDATALKEWSEAMPGYTIKGFTFNFSDEDTVTTQMKQHYFYNGWNSGDALHCRTRAIWDTNMLFISVKTFNKDSDARNDSRIYASIIDYSKQGLQANPILYWRHKGDTNWQQISFTSEGKDHFFVDIPALQLNSNIEYFISATSKSGHTETRPATAPTGFYAY